MSKIFQNLEKYKIIGIVSMNLKISKVIETGYKWARPYILVIK